MSFGNHHRTTSAEREDDRIALVTMTLLLLEQKFVAANNFSVHPNNRFAERLGPPAVHNIGEVLVQAMVVKVKFMID